MRGGLCRAALVQSHEARGVEQAGARAHGPAVIRSAEGVPGIIYPVDGPRPTKSSAEKRLYAALKAQLPDGWRAWHSLRLRSAAYSDSEGDFIIAAPELGMLVLEVKGGCVELVGGRWLQNGNELEKAPRQQAQGFARALVAAIQARGAKPPPWEIVCSFPDVSFSDGPTAGDIAGLVLGERELAWLSESLPVLAERALGSRPPPASHAWIECVHELWGETWVPRVCLADRVEDAERRRIALDEEQLQILDYAGDNQRALVEGGAGTGKSVIARELLRRNARDGKRTLYLCFTDALAAAMSRGFQGERTKAPLRAAAIRRYARDLVIAAGHVTPPPTPEFWDEVALQAACDALPPIDERPDLVVVDEAQDLEPSDWMLVEALVGDRGLWAFADPRQQFWRGREVPARLFASAARIRLKQQHRNPPELAAFALSYVDESQPRKRPDPCVLRLAVARDGDLVERVRHELDVLRKDGARPDDIAVLCLAGRDKSKLVRLERIGSHRVALADAADAPSRTIVDTFLRFKGLDRPIVIVTELVHGATMRYETRMHIALTRATVSAVVVCDEADVEADPRLQLMR